MVVVVGMLHGGVVCMHACRRGQQGRMRAARLTALRTPPPPPPLHHRSEGIVRWIKKKTGPAAADLKDKDALAAAEKANEVLVLGYFKELKVRCPGAPAMRRGLAVSQRRLRLRGGRGSHGRGAG